MTSFVNENDTFQKCIFENLLSLLLLKRILGMVQLANFLKFVMMYIS